jgi:hypothetical protein
LGFVTHHLQWPVLAQTSSSGSSSDIIVTPLPLVSQPNGYQMAAIR